MKTPIVLFYFLMVMVTLLLVVLPMVDVIPPFLNQGPTINCIILASKVLGFMGLKI
jgi:hypothetical protein